MATVPIARPRLLADVTADLNGFGQHVLGLCNTQGYMDDEPTVNAVWNGCVLMTRFCDSSLLKRTCRLLSICYPPTGATYLIFPEAYAIKGGLRADLVVREVAPANAGANYGMRQPVAYFEGKGGSNKAANWTNIREQMYNYLSKAISSTQNAGNRCWVVGAIGREVSFYRYTARNQGPMRMIPVSVQNGVVVSNLGDAGKLAPRIDLAAGWGLIEAILEHMSQNYAEY